MVVVGPGSGTTETLPARGLGEFWGSQSSIAPRAKPWGEWERCYIEVFYVQPGRRQTETALGSTLSPLSVRRAVDRCEVRQPCPRSCRTLDLPRWPWSRSFRATVAVQAEQIRILQAAGEKPAHIARRLGVARSSVYRMLESATVPEAGCLPPQGPGARGRCLKSKPPIAVDGNEALDRSGNPRTRGRAISATR